MPVEKLLDPQGAAQIPEPVDLLELRGGAAVPAGTAVVVGGEPVQHRPPAREVAHQHLGPLIVGPARPQAILKIWLPLKFFT